MLISQLIERLENARTRYGDLPVVVDNGDPGQYCHTDNGTAIVAVSAYDHLQPARDGESRTEAFCVNLF